MSWTEYKVCTGSSLRKQNVFIFLIESSHKNDPVK